MFFQVIESVMSLELLAFSLAAGLIFGASLFLLAARGAYRDCLRSFSSEGKGPARCGHAILSWGCGFAAEEQGSISIWALFLFMASCAIGASAVDVTHMFAARAQLQVAADIAAHSAIWQRNQSRVSADTAKADAIKVAGFGMPAEVYGEVLDQADFLFGAYDAAADHFVVDPNSREAVLVIAGREQASGNPVATFLFRTVGVGQMDVRASAVAIAYNPECLNEGFTAQGIIDINSNAYFQNFCIHSNTHVEFNQGNHLVVGPTVVSMPDLGDLVVPAGKLEGNPGLQQALRENEFPIRILDRIRPTATDPLEGGILTVGDDDRPDYLTSTSVVNMTARNRPYTPVDFTPGRVHRLTCISEEDTISLGHGTYSSFALLTNCQVQVSGMSHLENVIIYTTSTTDASVRFGASSSVDQVAFGKVDACTKGGGAQIITRGTFRSAANLQLNGAQIIALGDVYFAANAIGYGASIIAGGRIDGTSNMEFVGCGQGMEDNLNGLYVRLAR